MMTTITTLRQNARYPYIYGSLRPGTLAVVCGGPGTVFPHNVSAGETVKCGGCRKNGVIL